MHAWFQDNAVDLAMESLECGEAWGLVGQAPSGAQLSQDSAPILSVMLQGLHSQQAIPVTPSQGSAQVS